MRGLLVAAATVGLLGTACASDPEPRTAASPTPVPTPAETAETTPEPPSPEEGTDVCSDQTITGKPEATLRMSDNAFSPSCLVLLGGQGLKLANRGANRHNLTVESSELDIDVRAGETARTEAISGVVEPGTHRFFCRYHESLGMDGELTVTVAG
jgi:plastocyanin